MFAYSMTMNYGANGLQSGTLPSRGESLQQRNRALSKAFGGEKDPEN